MEEVKTVSISIETLVDLQSDGYALQDFLRAIARVFQGTTLNDIYGLKSKSLEERRSNAFDWLWDNYDRLASEIVAASRLMDVVMERAEKLKEQTEQSAKECTISQKQSA